MIKMKESNTQLNQLQFVTPEVAQVDIILNVIHVV